jgi:enamine deaminase RidA (YjgF/YER057c/UK114 family)
LLAHGLDGSRPGRLLGRWRFGPIEGQRSIGSDLSRVLSSTVYVVADTPEELGRVWDIVRRSELAAGPHASTLLGVSCLGYTGRLVEITAIAAVP